MQQRPTAGAGPRQVSGASAKASAGSRVLGSASTPACTPPLSGASTFLGSFRSGDLGTNRCFLRLCSFSLVVASEPRLLSGGPVKGPGSDRGST